jgi:hypothetical protein
VKSPPPRVCAARDQGGDDGEDERRADLARGRVIQQDGRIMGNTQANNKNLVTPQPQKADQPEHVKPLITQAESLSVTAGCN